MKPDFYPLSKKMWFCTFKFAWNLASKPTNRRDKVSAKSRRHAINLTGKAEHVPKRAWMDQQNHHITYYTLNHPNFLQINTNVRVWSINNNPNSPLAGFWDSVRIDRISPKFTHLGRVRTEFSASKFEYSQKSDKKPTEIDRNSPNSVGTKFFPKLNPKTLLVTHGIWTVTGPWGDP